MTMCTSHVSDSPSYDGLENKQDRLRVIDWVVCTVNCIALP